MNLEKDLIFCNDSILRIESTAGENVINYPLVDIQNFLGEPDLFILKFLKNPVYIEEGTTISNVIIALKPWIEIFDYFTGVKVSDYYKSCFKLGSSEQEFEVIKIKKTIRISRKYNFPDNADYSDIASLLNGKMDPTDLFNYEESLDCEAFESNDEKPYLIEYIHFNKLKNTLIMLEEKCNLSVYDNENKKAVFFDSISPDYSNNLPVEAEFTLEEVIRGIFNNGFIFETPISEDLCEEIAEDLEIIKKEMKPSLSLVKEDEEKTDSVVCFLPGTSEFKEIEEY